MRVKIKNKSKTVIVILGACMIYALSAGIRCIYGVLLNIIAGGTGIGYTAVSFAIAVAQLVYGIAQPIFGAIALKKSNCFVLALGNCLIALSLGMIPFCSSFISLLLFLGILFPVGAAAASFGIIMGAITPRLGEKKAAIASGFVNASSGFGNILLSPLFQKLYQENGLKMTMSVIALVAFILVPVALLVSEKKEKETEKTQEDNKISLLIKTAFKNKSFQILFIGFFACGFHIALVETHLYSQVLAYDIDETVASVVFSGYGAATLLGSVICGFICAKTQLKNVITMIYGSRIIWVIGFLLLPKNLYTITIFVFLCGITGASILSPLIGMIGKMYGTEVMATLYGIVFLSHQIGGFFGSWMGAKCVEIFGNYTMVWMISVGLTSVATITSMKIKEREKLIYDN